MWQLVVGSLVLSIIHGMIPNHWIPLVAIGKSEKWTIRETLFATSLTGFAHTLSTVIIGIIVGFVGLSLSNHFELITSVIAPIVLVSIGLVYIVLDYIQGRHHHHHEHVNTEKVRRKKSKWAIILTLSIAMLFSPCLEIEAYYFKAGTQGWPGIFTISGIYLVVTILMMMMMVFLGMKGVERIKSKYLEHHEKQISGIVLIILGLVAYFVEF